MILKQSTGRMFSLLGWAVCMAAPLATNAGAQKAPVRLELPSVATTNTEINTKPVDFAQRGYPDAVAGVFYAGSIQAIGGTGFHVLEISGDLPPGMWAETGSSTMLLQGVPKEPGTYNLQVTAVDTAGRSITRNFALNVLAPIPNATNAVPVIDNENFALADVDSVFFPAQVVVNENFGMADSLNAADAPDVIDPENFFFTDVVTVNVRLAANLSWTAPPAIGYGTPLGSRQLTPTSDVAGSCVFTPPAGTVLPAGNQLLTATFNPTDTATYGSSSVSTVLAVNAAPLSVVVNAQSMSFGSPIPPLTGTLNGVVNNDGITASYSTTATPSSPVGTYPITATLNDPGGRLIN